MRLTKPALGAAALLLACQKEPVPPVPVQENPAAEATKSDREQSEPKRTASEEREVSAATKVVAPGLGHCAPTAEIESFGRELIERADADRNGSVSRKEAQSLLNFLMGGIFFRADENSDGTVTAEEGRQARQTFAEEYPMFDRLLAGVRTLKDESGQRPFARIAEIMDVNYSGSLSAKEVRDAAQQALDELYRVVDRDKDSHLTRSEAQQASLDGAAALGHHAFVAADGNADGAVDLSELEGALRSGAKTAFNAADGNGDGKLTEAEASQLLLGLTRRLAPPTSAQN